MLARRLIGYLTELLSSSNESLRLLVQQMFAHKETSIGSNVRVISINNQGTLMKSNLPLPRNPNEINLVVRAHHKLIYAVQFEVKVSKAHVTNRAPFYECHNSGKYFSVYANVVCR